MLRERIATAITIISSSSGDKDKQDADLRMAP